MNKFVYIFFLLCYLFFLSKNTNGQNKKRLSFDKINTLTSDTAKISALLNLCYEFKNVQKYDTCVFFAELAVTLSEKNKNYKAGECYLNFAEINDFIGATVKAVDFYEKSVNLLSEDVNSVHYMDALKGLARVLVSIGDYSSALAYNIHALQLAENANDKKRMADNIKNIGLIYDFMGDSQKATEYYLKSLNIFKQLNDDIGQVKCLLNLGYVYLSKDNFKSSIESAQKASKLLEKHDNFLLKSACYSFYGDIYNKQGLYDKAFDNITKSYEIFEKQNYNVGKTITLSSLGSLSLNIGDTTKAEIYFNRSMELAMKGQMKKEIQDLNFELANIYKAKKNYKKAFSYYETHNLYKDSLFNENVNRQVSDIKAKYESEKKEKEIKNFKYLRKYGVIIIVLISLFSIFLIIFLQKINKSYKQLKYQQEQNLVILEELHFQKNQIQEQKRKLEDSNSELEKLSLVAKKTDNKILIADVDGDIEWVNESFEKAFGYAEKDIMYSNTKDKNLSELLQVIKKGIEKCTLASKPITITTNIRDKFNEKHWYQISVSPIYNSLSEIIRFIAIGSDITQIKLAEMEIKIQHFEIEQQHKQIIAQNVEITDSILYSQRIQRSIMPPLSEFKSIFENSFIFYQPKNIVSGDFYWVAEKRNEKIIVVGDCTGHGVPGAFMSMLGIVLLNEIVNKHQDLGYNFRLNSSQVLDSLRIKLKKTLHQKGISGEANDGMDIAICIFNLKEQKIQFSGANQSLHIVRNNQMLKINGDRMPIGVYTENDQNFTKTDVKVYENDVFYLATDGYSDQFGGSGDKKFLTKNFKEMLISIHELPFDEQKQILSDIYEGWRGEQEQTDDILVLGFKV